MRRLITEFDGSAEAAKRLQDATDGVRTSIDTQQRAILAYNQATRVQNFQLIESLRLVRSVTSTFSSLNQVYQTLVLRQIASTQTTVAQQQAFEGVERFTKNLVNALDILGPANEEVLQGFEDLISKADQLSSDQIQKLIDAYIKTGQEANLSGAELEAFNKNLEKLKQLLEETETEESTKQFNDLFGAIAAGGTAVGVLGQLALNLSKVEAVAKLFRGGAPAGAGLAGLVLLLPELLRLLGLDPAPIKETLPNGQIRGQTSFTGRFEQVINELERQRKVEINLNNPTFNSEIEVERVMDIIQAKLAEEAGLGVLE